MNELELECSWVKIDYFKVTVYEKGDTFKDDKLNVSVIANGKQSDIMLSEESSLKLLEFLKEKLEDK